MAQPYEQHKTLIKALTRLLEAKGNPPRLVETHISSLLLHRDKVWKLKKPVDLGFLDFTRLDQRRHYCEEELRLNRRTAPQLYLGLRTLYGAPDRPALSPNGRPLDYLVEMRRFADDALLADHPHHLDETLTDRLCDQVLALHAAAEIAPRDGQFGTPARVMAPLLENYRLIRELDQTPATHALIDQFERWARQQPAKLAPLIQHRRTNNHIRECHGDLHLGNIALIDGHPTLFDAIEFSPALRWIDTLSDLAFLLMDLHDHQLPAAANQLLNRYLERANSPPRHASGVGVRAKTHPGNTQTPDSVNTPSAATDHTPDEKRPLPPEAGPGEGATRSSRERSLSETYHALPLLPFYLHYRATVRAKIAAIRHHQQPSDETEQQLADYLALAQGYLETPFHAGPIDIRLKRPILAITRGPSGAGKSYLARFVAGSINAIHIRADVVRKRLAGLRPEDDSSQLDHSIYTPEFSANTYQQMRRLAERSLQAGLPTIVDATFLKHDHRTPFNRLAKEQGVPFLIFDLSTPERLMRERITQRTQQGRDPSEANHAVLSNQLPQRDRLSAAERERLIPITPDTALTQPWLRKALACQPDIELFTSISLNHT